MHPPTCTTLASHCISSPYPSRLFCVKIEEGRVHLQFASAGKVRLINNQSINVRASLISTLGRMDQLFGTDEG